jgi:1-acyl-sn-glycerol-3-phosphate acyltransferase
LSRKIRRIASREAHEQMPPQKRVAARGLRHIRVIAGVVIARASLHARKIGAWAYGCYAWSVFALIVLSFGGLVVLLRRPSQGRRVARFGARLLFRLARIPLSAEGLDRLPARSHVLVVNHTSFLDGLVLTALLPACPGHAFTVRQEFEIQRLLCPLLRSLGTVVLGHSHAEHGASNVDLMTLALRRRKNLLIFPEGGFIPEPGLRPFHSGAFAAAANANVPVVVAGLRGVRSALRPRTWLPRRVRITLEIGPVLTACGNDPDAIAQLSASARKAMVPLSGESDPYA